MNLTLRRDPFEPAGTTGTLLVNGAVFCRTLERPAPQFVDEFPCIPAGTYKVLLQHSEHFGRIMPFLQDVPGRTAIEIHWANFIRELEGCIAVGTTISREAFGLMLENSHSIFNQLYQQLYEAQLGGITITVQDAPPEAT